MKCARRAATLVAAIALYGTQLVAQETTEAIVRRQQRTLDSLGALLSALQARMDSVGAAPVPSVTPGQQSPAGRGTYMNIGFVGLIDAGFDREGRRRAAARRSRSKVRGFTIPNAELDARRRGRSVLQGLRAISSTSWTRRAKPASSSRRCSSSRPRCPANLQLKGGQFFTEFGRQNPQHPHSWAFVDQPLVLNRDVRPRGTAQPGRCGSRGWCRRRGTPRRW